MNQCDVELDKYVFVRGKNEIPKRNLETNFSANGTRGQGNFSEGDNWVIENFSEGYNWGQEYFPEGNRGAMLLYRT